MQKHQVPKPQTLRSEINDIAAPGTLSPSDGSISLHDAQTFQNIQQESHLELDKDESDLEECSDSDLRDHDSSYDSGTSVVAFNFWTILGRGAINIILPFINGIALGFGEILAHELGFRYGFLGARVYPSARMERKRPQSKFI